MVSVEIFLEDAVSRFGTGGMQLKIAVDFFVFGAFCQSTRY